MAGIPSRPTSRSIRVLLAADPALVRAQGAIVLLSMHHYEAFVRAALEAGASGYVVNEAAAALTPRERDVLRLLARGLSSKEIGVELGIEKRTVDGHRAGLMKRLGIHSIPALVKYAIRNQLATLEE